MHTTSVRRPMCLNTTFGDSEKNSCKTCQKLKPWVKLTHNAMTYKGVCWMCVWGCVCECVSKTHTYSVTGKIFERLLKPVLTHTVIKIQVYPRCARNCSSDKYVFWYLVYILIHHIKHFLGNNYMMECISNK